MGNQLSEKDLAYLSTTEVSAEEYMKSIENTIKSVFPNSYISIKLDKSFGKKVIRIVFALGKDNKEWNNRIIQNDPLWCTIWIYGIDENDFMKDIVLTEMSSGGSFLLNENEPGGYKLQSVKIGFRKTKGDTDKILKSLKNYFLKAKKLIGEYKDKMKNPEFIKSKL